jgi:hypothetical protein
VCGGAQTVRGFTRSLCSRADAAHVSREWKGNWMSKGQRGNKEAKKPKKVKSAVKPVVSGDAIPIATGPAAAPLKKK